MTTPSKTSGRCRRPHLACLLTLFLVGCDGETGGQQASNPPPPPVVTVAAPLKKAITEWYEFTGRFEAVEAVDVRARVSGYVEEIVFADGDIITKDAPLFVIDPRPYQAVVEEAEAALESARARVELADAELERAEELMDRGNVSRSTYDQRLQEKRVAEASVETANAALRRAELDLGFTEVRAPITGRVSDRRVDIGNLVTGDPNATLLTTIVALDPIYFAFDISESDFLGYQRAVNEGVLPGARDNGTEVQLRLPDEPDTETWPRFGRMNFVDNRIDEDAGTIRARAELPNEDQFILPGQFGRLRLPGSPEYEAILIPDSAIVTDQAAKMVMTVNAENMVEPRVIRPGPSYAGGLRIVREGLGIEDRIIINGLMRARPGSPVTPEEGTIEGPPAAAANDNASTAG